MTSRLSVYSAMSEPPGGRTGPSSTQLSSTTLLNALHGIYVRSLPYQLDAGTAIVVNTWLTAAHDDAQPGTASRGGPTSDTGLAARAWEHSRRRAEDGCIMLVSLHPSTPSVLGSFLRSFPVALPSSLYEALDVVMPFIRCITPHNPTAPMQSGLATTLTFNLAGTITAAKISLTQSGIDVKKGLLDLPREPGYRAFGVFYYLLTSASAPAEREFLGLKPASTYSLLAKSGTYDPPSYLPSSDDAAAADDFRTVLKAIGIKGGSYRSLISTLAGLLKLGNTLEYHVDADELEEICEDAGGLLGLEPDVLLRQCSTEDRATFIAGLYEALVDWVIGRANGSVAAQMARIRDGQESLDGRASRVALSEGDGDTVCITVVELSDPDLGRAVALRGVFDDSVGINAEMRQDGVDLTPAGSSILKETQAAVAAVAPDLGIMVGTLGRLRQASLDRREAVLDKVGLAAEENGFVKNLLYPIRGQGVSLGLHARVNLSAVLAASRVWYHLSIHPTDESPIRLAALPSITSAWSAGTVSRQLRSWHLPEWANRRNRQLDFTADFDFDEFTHRYGPLGCRDGRDGIDSWILERGWSNGAVFVGHERVWMRENAWWEAESMLDLRSVNGPIGVESPGLATGYSATGSAFLPAMAAAATPYGSRDRLIHHRNPSQGNASIISLGLHAHNSVAPSPLLDSRDTGDYGLGFKGDTRLEFDYDHSGLGDAENANRKKIETRKIDLMRQSWVILVWTMTFWIPSPLLRWLGGMQRPDVRMAWREKLVLVFIIVLINAAIIFWIVEFGNLLCPNQDKVWSTVEVSNHQSGGDFYVALHGKVYDLTRFWHIDHSDSNIAASPANMLPLAGLTMDDYFPPPLTHSCPGLGISERLIFQPNNSLVFPQASHVSGFYSDDPSGALSSDNWYYSTFVPKVQQYYIGDLVWDPSFVTSDGQNGHLWVLYQGSIYDLTNYFYNLNVQDKLPAYAFLHTSLTDIVQEYAGQDVTQAWTAAISSANSTNRAAILNSLNCIKNTFFVGTPDFRLTARCQVNNYILLGFTIILCAVILVKFLAALQFGSKRQPAMQDKFVICQVPTYTEDEDSLRRAIDSLTALQYDNKRKLIFLICDGIITGQGNDRPTPKIVLDIVGVDPKIDPPALPFKSVGPGGEQLNYGKVYSGLYEFEGNVVPYVVVVKVGRPLEQERSKPGNRGKRDSQILLMNFLNRVHHQKPMNPLELEIFHQISNVIGVDPELYEFMLMVDADTSVAPDSLNRLVAACVNDARISGICGETSLQNDEKSWWTMIQVYEYFISYYLAKAFESLFGAVTCLPGCFSLYRLRTVDKHKPLIISDAVIREYSLCEVDTLHQKNLLSLGEDRYLTTLMTKHFPHMSNKFLADATCQTAAPDSWSVLLSQRRRWINSTVHNLVELMRLREMCGFCCFSMRFVVFIDLFGTIILPATCVYLGYLLYRVGTHTGQFPLLSLVMLAAVYGLQALIYILKRQWQHIGWMVIYIIAYPIYSFVLPLYSFWNQDNFSWGNTRIVIGEKGDKKIVAVDDDSFDPRSIPLQRWDDYALANQLPGRRGVPGDEFGFGDAMDKEESRSVYSAAVRGSLRGFPITTPVTPASVSFPYPYVDGSLPPAYQTNTYGAAVGNAGWTGPKARQSMISLGAPSIMPELGPSHSPYGGDTAGGLPYSSSNLRASRLSLAPTRPVSSFDFQRGNVGPDDGAIIDAVQTVLREVDLDTVTKKQMRVLVEQRIQMELVGDRRVFMDRQIDRELEAM